MIGLEPPEDVVLEVVSESGPLSKIYDLRKQHNETARELWILRMLLWRRDWQDDVAISNRAFELETFFKLHVSKEESTLLAMIRDLNVKPEIARGVVSIFQEHKIILASFRDLHDSLIGTSFKERSVSFQKLDKMISDHMKDENDNLFPSIICEIQLENGLTVETKRKYDGDDNELIKLKEDHDEDNLVVA